MQRILSRGTFLGALLVALLAGAYWFVSRPETTPFSAAFAQTATDSATIDTSDVPEMSIGKADAPVTIIEYGSFTCPHCADFHHDVFPLIKKNYIDTGKARFIFREVYFDRFGLWAGIMARCGGPVRYFGIVDMIYKDQKGWLAGGDPAKATQNLRTMGRAAGITDKQLDACFSDTENAKKLVAWYQKNATKDDLKGTPSFIINGKHYGNMSYKDFAKVLDGMLAK